MTLKSLKNIAQIHITEGLIVHKINVIRGEIIRVKIGWNGNKSTRKNYGSYSYGKLTISREDRKKFNTRISSLLKKADESKVTIFDKDGQVV